MDCALIGLVLREWLCINKTICFNNLFPIERSFHQRLFTFAPFGDGRIALAKLQLMKIRMRLILYQHILILKYMSLLPLRRLAEFIHQMQHRIAWQGVVPFLRLALAAHLIHGAREILENIKGLRLQRQLAFAERTG